MQEYFSEHIKMIPREKLISINEENAKEWNGEYWINVDLEIEPTKQSSLYPDTSWNLYLLVKKIDGKWLIADTTTG